MSLVTAQYFQEAVNGAIQNVCSLNRIAGTKGCPGLAVKRLYVVALNIF